VAQNSTKTLRTLERLAPGTPLRQGLERILQQGKGAIIVIGHGEDIDAISSGGFPLRQPQAFTPARLAELAKMDGGIILDDEADNLIAANVHFVPSNDIPSDETGARHRTAQRIALQTGRPVVAVSEGRKIATLYLDGQKIELRSPTEVAARVNQELQTLDRLRRRLDEAEANLTQLEATNLATYRNAVTLIQRAELVRRVGKAIEREAVSLGDEGRLAYIQLADLVRGVTHLQEMTLRDYLSAQRIRSLAKIVERLQEMDETDLDDPAKVGKVIGFPDLDEPVTPRGYRILSKVGRLPEPVREELIRHFKKLPRILAASPGDFEKVEGIGATRASHLRHFLDRLLAVAENWAPQGI
jgi:diadenylate cyclase